MCYYKAFHGVAPNRWRSFPICKALQSVVRCRFLGLIILRCGVVGAVFCCKGTQKSFGAVGFGKNHTEPHLTVRKKHIVKGLVDFPACYVSVFRDFGFHEIQTVL